MAIDVLIKQKLLGRKTMPLDIILGEHLHYGNFVNDQLYVGDLGKNEFVAYNPESIGRGFSVVWNPEEKKTIALRLPQPSTVGELKDFYAAAERMAKFWDGKLIVDGTPIRLSDFLSSFDSMVAFNEKIIKMFSEEVFSGKRDELTMYSAMWPLSMGKEEAALFRENPAYYAEWLHEKQSMDVYYASPRFFAGENGISAKYVLINDCPTVFPNQPEVPFGVTDPATGKPLECKEWLLWIVIEGKEEPICEMEYVEFLNRIPENKKVRYDGRRFLLSGLTEDELSALFLQ